MTLCGSSSRRRYPPSPSRRRGEVHGIRSRSELPRDPQRGGARLPLSLRNDAGDDKTMEPAAVVSGAEERRRISQAFHHQKRRRSPALRPPLRGQRGRPSRRGQREAEPQGHPPRGLPYQPLVALSPLSLLLSLLIDGISRGHHLPVVCVFG